jgi:hypothetical protein
MVLGPLSAYDTVDPNNVNAPRKTVVAKFLIWIMGSLLEFDQFLQSCACFTRSMQSSMFWLVNRALGHEAVVKFHLTLD